MEDMDKDTVDFVPNYDETPHRADRLPRGFPEPARQRRHRHRRRHGHQHAAAQPRRVIDGICAQIDNPEITLEGLMKYVKGPDFPTGCMICGLEGIKDYFETGRGSVKVRGKDRRRGAQRRPRADHHHRDSVQRESRRAGRADRRTGQREDPHRTSPPCAMSRTRTPAS